MKVLKYKYLKPNRYKLFLDDKEIILYEDIIIKNNILIKKEISEEELETYLSDNTFYEYYYKALNYIKFRLRSKKEIKDYLNKYNISLKNIDNIIKDLEKNGYINDKVFAKYYIKDEINLKNSGPVKIKTDLKKLGILEEIIDDELVIFTKDMQVEKIEKYINKELKLNKNKSVYILKNKIKDNLINKGYYKEDILMLLENVDFDENAIYEKEYEKLKNKLSKKYSGNELELKIKQKLYVKGLYK